MKYQYPDLWHQLPLLGWLWLTTALVAQPPADSLNCDYRLKVASEYLCDFGFASHVMIEEIKASVINCDNNSTDETNSTEA